MKRKYYRITYKEYKVEGFANSPYHACKLAFKELIKAKIINQPPLFNQELEVFPDTEVEIIQEPEHG